MLELLFFFAAAGFFGTYGMMENWNDGIMDRKSRKRSNRQIKLNPHFRLSALVGLILFCLLPTGCEQPNSDYGNEELLRVSDRVLTVHDFNEAFEISKTAYAHSIRQQSEDLRDAQIRLLNQLTVEMLILERGEEQGISLTDEELENAVSDIKSDYPEGEFEKTLIEFAVSYDAWLSRLKTRLTVSKVVDEELKNRISISAEDIADYYKNNYQGRENETDRMPSSEDINETIVKQLRREKAEQAYKSWIEELKAIYPIEINSEQWDRITAPRKKDDNEADGGRPKSE